MRVLRLRVRTELRARRLDQAAGDGGTRLGEPVRRDHLDDLAFREEGDPVADPHGRPKVVRDEEPRGAPGLQSGEELEHVALHGGVERRERFVKDHEVRVGGERTGAGDALEIPAGELVRQPARASLRGDPRTRGAPGPVRDRFLPVA